MLLSELETIEALKHYCDSVKDEVSEFAWNEFLCYIFKNNDKCFNELYEEVY